MMLIPTLIYGYLFSAEISCYGTCRKRCIHGRNVSIAWQSIIYFHDHLYVGTAITELFTGQWIDVLLKNVTDNPILILTVSTGVMVIGRAFAGPIVHRLAPQGVLLMSAIIAAIGFIHAGKYFR